jgi:enoyl-CoA hydratase/carnithine racemase
VKIEREAGLLRVTLDRGDQRNVLTSGDCAELAIALRDAEANAVLIESTGQFFCAGAEEGCDLHGLLEPDTWKRKPVVAAVQGPALDEGLALIACAHVVVSAQGTTFALTPMRKGVFPAVTYAALARAIGERRALEVTLTARVFTAPDALAWGLVHHVAPAFEFDDRASALATEIAKYRVDRDCFRGII